MSDFIDHLKQLIAKIWRLEEQGRLDGLLLLPLFLGFALVTTAGELWYLGSLSMLVWGGLLLMPANMLYRLFAAAVAIALLVYAVFFWPAGLAALVALLFLVWLRRSARHQVEM